jgi:serine protease Do
MLEPTWRWLLLFALWFATAASADVGDLHGLAASVFRIEAADSAGRLHSGSGVLVGAHTLVTTCHTLSSAQDIHVIDGEARLRARLVRANSEHDLCLLSVPGVKGVPATLGSTAGKRKGDAIIAVGFPAGASLTVSRGHIEGLFTYGGSGRVIQGSAYFTLGKSGGALFDTDGWLIGILTFKCRAGGPYHFSVPVEWAKTLLEDVSTPVDRLTGKAFWQHTDERQPVFLRAASLFAEGDCELLKALTAQWLAREPDNAEAILMARRAQLCHLLEKIQRPLLEK